MLYLNPPFQIIDGVSVFPDHADPRQFYYLPVSPHVTTVPDPATQAPVPQLEVIKYRGDAGNGGFLNFDVNIGVGQDVLDGVAQEIKHSQQLNDPPRLAPVPLVDGSVRMMLFGAQTQDPTPAAAGAHGGAAAGGGTAAGGAGSAGGAAATATTVSSDGGAGAPGQPKFVLRINQGAKPSLYGDCQAAFSVQLDQYGVTVLDAALQGELSPIGIVYGLDFLALRPAYSVRLHADWNRVQTHLDEEFGIDAVFVSTQIENAVDKLIDERAITLEADTFVPEGEDTAGIISDEEKAKQEVRDMITNAFFTPSLDPVAKPQPDGWDKASGLLTSLTRMGLTGGASALGTFTYKKIDYTRVDNKVLNVNMSERTTVRRTIFPQGHLSALFRLLDAGGIDLGRFVISADLNDPWFARRRVKAISRAAYDQDSIRSVDVDLQYGSEPKNAILDTANQSANFDWESSVENGAMERDVTVGYAVTFHDVDGTQRPTRLEAPPATTQVENIEIDPRALYNVTQVPIIALAFPFDRYPTVEVEVRYSDDANAIHLAQTFLLDQAHPQLTWPLFSRAQTRPTFEYKITYRAADNQDVEGSWTSTGDQQVFVRDPYPMARSVQIVPTVSWSEVTGVYVDLSYDDVENHLHQEAALTFSPTDAAPKAFSVQLRDPDKRLVAYEVALTFADGRFVQVPRSYTLDRRVFVRSDMRGHRVVTIAPAHEDFAAKQVTGFTVETRYEDDAAGLSFGDRSDFASPADRASFEFDYVDPQKSQYEFRATYRFTNGLSRDTDWTVSDADTLVVPVG